MTTIATDGQEIAADGLACFGDEVTFRDRRKLVVQGGYIFAICGVSAMQQPLIDWHLSGAKPDDVPKCTDDTGWSLLVWGPGLDDRVYYASACVYPSRFPKVWAYGSGGDFAMGALKAGVSAQRAIEIACEMNIHTGGEIQVVNIAAALAPKLEVAA